MSKGGGVIAEKPIDQDSLICTLKKTDNPWENSGQKGREKKKKRRRRRRGRRKKKKKKKKKK